ncbi:MAG: sulfatase family protein [Planctomycetota bacterium]|jgi:arylsulfatase A-like enzyme
MQALHTLLLVIVLIAAPLPAAARTGPDALRPPNIILLQADDLHHQALGCMGDVVRTPHIDALAARGVVFRNAVAQGTACAPSRNSLLTGSYPHQTGVFTNRDGRMQRGIWTVPMALQRAGYSTALVGKNHFRPHTTNGRIHGTISEVKGLGFDSVHSIKGKLGAARGRYRPGLDPYQDYLHERGLLDALQSDYREHRVDTKDATHPSVLSVEDYQDSYIAARAIDWIDAYDADRPFFLWVDFVAPHPPADAPDPYSSMYDPSQMRGPIGVQEGSAEADSASRFRAGYYGMISLLDAQVGRIVEALRRKGLLDTTLIVFCSDQGSMLGDHGLWGKNSFYKGAINVPIVVAGPAPVQHGGVVDRTVELLDLAKTFLELANASLEDREQCRGESLLPLLTGSGHYQRRTAFAEDRERKMVVTQRFKYVEHPEEPLLFDVLNDPEEHRNIVDARPAVVMRMTRELKRWRAIPARERSQPPASVAPAPSATGPVSARPGRRCRRRRRWP